MEGSRSIKSRKTTQQASLRRSNRLLEKREHKQLAATNSWNNDAVEFLVNFQQDQTVLSGIFPEEIWLLIFKTLSKSPETLENISNSSRFFRHLLLPKRTLFLFSKVWSNLVQKYDGKWSKQSEKNEESLCSMFLLIRTVCKEWNTKVTDFYQNASQHYSLGYMDPSSTMTFEDFKSQPKLYSWATTDVLTGKEDIHQFMDHFEPTHGNSKSRSPFMLNTVMIKIGKEEKRNITRELVEKYGHHISHCTIIMKPRVPTIEHLTCFSHVLSAMPNVRSIWYKHDCILEVNLEALENEVRQWELPTFTSLEFVNACTMPAIILKKIISKAPNLKILDFDDCIANMDFELSVPWPKLETLCLTIDWEKQWNNLQNFSPNLCMESLQLSLNNPNVTKWSDGMKLLQNKFPNLQNLVLALPQSLTKRQKRVLQNKNASLKLQLPKLKRLRLELHTFITLDYLLPLKHPLEVLYIDIVVQKAEFETRVLEENAEQHSVIKVFSCIDNLKESNIWSLLPALKTVHVKMCGSKCRTFHRPTA